VKKPLWQAKILIKPALGIYLVTTWFDDGSVEEKEIPLGQIIIPKDLP
jgi:hypothetical protein